MAKRRMFSHRIVSSAHFKKMPISSQALYFHLCMEADDDGIVEAWPIMQISGFAEDDLRVLTAKELVKVLNEDLVTYIFDWREHNLIRPDHKVDSMYKKLLLQVLPEAELVTPAPRSDVQDNSRRITGLSTDSTRTSHGPNRIGEVSRGEVSKNTHGGTEHISADHFNDVYRILNAFETVNRHWLQLEGNRKQYDAAERLLGIHGVDKVLGVVAVLSTTNKMKYVTTVTTPVQLEMKWSELEAQLAKQSAITSGSKKQIIA